MRENNTNTQREYIAVWYEIFNPIKLLHIKSSDRMNRIKGRKIYGRWVRFRWCLI